MNTTTQQVKMLLSQVDNIAQQYGFEKELDSLKKHIEKAEKHQINLLVCGEFKRGKSSFINALLSENICPENIGIATSAISVIGYGKNPKVIRHFGKLNEIVEDQDRSRVELQTEEIELSDIAKFVDGTTADIQHTVMLEIMLPNEHLKNGLTIIDTPGIGSLDPRHLFLTLYALPKADIIYFLTDVEEPLQQSELNFYQSRIASTGKINRILVNKSDLKLRKEVNTIIQDINTKISNQSVKVIPVSAELWKQFNEDNTNIDAQQGSHRDDVYEAIRLDMLSCSNYFSERIRSQCVILLGKLLQVIENRKKVVSNKEDIQQKKNELEQEISKLKKIQNNITNPNSILRKTIAKKLDSSQKEVLNVLSKENVLLSTNKFDDILKDKRATAEGGENFVINTLNEAIVHLSDDLDQKTNACFKEIINMVGNEIVLSEGHFAEGLDVNISPLQQTLSEKVMTMTRQSLPVLGVTGLVSIIGGAGVGLVGGLFGASMATITAVAPYIALPLGIAAGIGFVIKSIKDNKRQTAIAHLRSQVAPRITIAMNEMRQYIQNRFDEFKDILVNSLADSAEQLSKQMQEIVESIKQCEVGEQEKKAEETKIENQITFINGLITQARVFNTNPFAKK